MSLLRTAARVGVASSVHGKVQRRQGQRFAAQDQAAAAQQFAAPPPAAPAPVAPPVAPPPAAQSTDDLLASLERLGQLRAAGVLTEAEFETQKARILG